MATYILSRIHTLLALHTDDRTRIFHLIFSYCAFGEWYPLYRMAYTAVSCDTPADSTAAHSLPHAPSSGRNEAYSSFIEMLNAHWYDARLGPVKEKLYATMASLAATAECMANNDIAHERIAHLARTFSLSDLETDVVMFVYVRECEELLDPLKEQRQLGVKRCVLHLFATLTSTPMSVARLICSPQCILNTLQFIDEYMEISPQLFRYISGESDVPILLNFYTHYSGTTIPVDAFSIGEHHSQIVSAIITCKQPDEKCHILLYGEPGTGKTAYARSLAASLNMSLYEVHCQKHRGEYASTHDTPFCRYAAFYACEKTIPHTHSIILMDEADDMLNTDGIRFSRANSNTTLCKKSRINELLDSAHTVVIWITNTYDLIDISTRRRFDYSLHFTTLSREQRQSVWKTIARTHHVENAFSPATIDRLSRTYRLNPGAIDILVRNYARLPEALRSPKTLETLIAQHTHLMSEPHQSRTQSLISNYTLDGLNVSGKLPLCDAVQIIKEFYASLDTPTHTTASVRTMNVLLHGPPGTGKSAWVTFLADALDKELIVARGSDLLSCYVGQTEKNIAALFYQAQHARAILFIDEVDGLLFSRTNAIRSFETTQVNELLTHIEHFTGTLVCATNHIEHVDHAAFRRFTLTYTFDYLMPEGCRIFYDLYLTPLVARSLKMNANDHAPHDTMFATPKRSKAQDNQLASLARLTPGDFKTVAHTYAFIPRAHITHDTLISALAAECKIKNDNTTHTIGF